MPRDFKTELEAAWSAFLAKLPDRSELSDYQLQRSKELFAAGFAAAWSGK